MIRGIECGVARQVHGVDIAAFHNLRAAQFVDNASVVVCRQLKCNLSRRENSAAIISEPVGVGKGEMFRLRQRVKSAARRAATFKQAAFGRNRFFEVKVAIVYGA